MAANDPFAGGMPGGAPTKPAHQENDASIGEMLGGAAIFGIVAAGIGFGVMKYLQSK